MLGSTEIDGVDMKRIGWIAIKVVTLAGCAMAQQAPPAQQSPPLQQTAPAQQTPPPLQAPPAQGEPVRVVMPQDTVALDALLDGLHERGQTLRDFSGNVALVTTDTSSGEDPTTQTGQVVYQKLPDQNARIRITFEKKTIGERTLEQRIEYLLDGEWLTDRDYRRRIEVRRQVLRPGEKVDLLKLGEGPFPMPIGQPRDAVKNLFDVSLLPVDAAAPAGSSHVRLVPKSGTDLSRKFTSIDVWVDPTLNMPVRIDTLDRNETVVRRTDLANLKVNAGVSDKAFELPAVNDKEWTRQDEAFGE